MKTVYCNKMHSAVRGLFFDSTDLEKIEENAMDPKLSSWRVVNLDLEQTNKQIKGIGTILYFVESAYEFDTRMTS